jgi:hypothetical protein
VQREAKYQMALLLDGFHAQSVKGAQSKPGVAARIEVPQPLALDVIPLGRKR